MTPHPNKLDHVALYVSDPEGVAARILSQLPFRIIEESEEFVLVGRDPELGKLTLFHADSPREAGVVRSVGIGIPCGTVERTIDIGDGLRLELVPADPEGEVEVVHFAVVTPDPASSAREWLQFGFAPAPKSTDGVPRVRLGSQHVELHTARPEPTDRPLLNHLGLLVDDLDELRASVDSMGVAVNREVDAENSRALFLDGPDGVELEYIEHKPSFALA
jgi:catechol 2,3-dioxygenase-like lactoylglutathione lyase family enzyme